MIIIITLFLLVSLSVIILAVDYRIIKENNNNKLVCTYILLIIIGVAIGYIAIHDLPVPSPATIIEKIVISLIKES
ncbi:MAG: hypothetical protein ACLKAK_03885 [Alkaliphilus sp.]